MNPIEVERQLVVDEPEYQVWMVTDAESGVAIGFDEVDLEASR